jgi:hypothetical protein
VRHLEAGRLWQRTAAWGRAAAGAAGARLRGCDAVSL